MYFHRFCAIIRISIYNEKYLMFLQALYDGLNDVNPQYWRDIIAIQKNWIGQCTGTTIDFVLKVILLRVYTGYEKKYMQRVS